MATIGENIRRYRKLRGLTQEELAKKIGVSTMSIRRYESGDRLLPEKVLSAIATALNIGVTFLLPPDIYWEDEIGEHMEPQTKIGRKAKEQGVSVEEYIARFVKESNRGNLLDAYNSLNDEGQKVAVERVTELTEIPKYQRGEDHESQDEE